MFVLDFVPVSFRAPFCQEFQASIHLKTGTGYRDFVCDLALLCEKPVIPFVVCDFYALSCKIFKPLKSRAVVSFRKLRMCFDPIVDRPRGWHAAIVPADDRQRFTIRKPVTDFLRECRGVFGWTRHASFISSFLMLRKQLPPLVNEFISRSGRTMKQTAGP